MKKNIQKIEEFILNIHKVENNSNNNLPPIATKYLDVFDKYLNGECESLVYYIYGFLEFDEKCIMVEISNKQKNIFHYCLKYQNYYFDINGKFENINLLAKKSKLFYNTNSLVISEIPLKDKKIDYYLNHIKKYCDCINQNIKNEKPQTNLKGKTNGKTIKY